MKNSLKLKTNLLAALFLGLLPVITYAQGLKRVISNIQELLGLIVPLVISLAVIYFLWGVLSYVTAKDPAKQKEARSIMIYGVVILFVMVSVWGLVALLGETLDVGTGAAPSAGNLLPRN